MAISSLYHTQGLRGYKYQKTERTADCETYYLHSTAKQLACPRCQSRDTSIVQTGRTRDTGGFLRWKRVSDPEGQCCWNRCF